MILEPASVSLSFSLSSMFSLLALSALDALAIPLAITASVFPFALLDLSPQAKTPAFSVEMAISGMVMSAKSNVLKAKS